MFYSFFLTHRSVRIVTLAALLLLVGAPLRARADDVPQARAREVHALLQQIAFEGGDHLGYAQEFGAYLSERYHLPELVWPRERSDNRRREVDPYALLSGGLALRESMQLDTLRAGPEEETESTVTLASLHGPQAKSHPFRQMLGKRHTAAPDLARLAPHDFYYLHVADPTKFVPILDYVEDVGGSLYTRYVPEGINYEVRAKQQQQLGLEARAEHGELYARVVREIAVVGSDPFMRNGSDVSLILRARQAGLLRSGLAALRARAAARTRATTTRGTIAGLNFELLSTPDARVRSYLLELDDETTVISNSARALERIVATARGAHPALAGLDEYRYMRSIYPYDPDREDAFLYLSDPFIRRLTGPEVRVKEARRMREALRLASLERHAVFYYQMRGKYATQVADLEQEFPRETVARFRGLELEPGTFSARSPRYGRLGYLTPNLDLDLEKVTPAEAEAYQQFLREYEEYWRTYFDPVGVRIRFDQTISIETCILPLVDNTVYRMLQAWLGGAPVELRALSRALPGETMSAAFKLDPGIFSAPDVRRAEERLNAGRGRDEALRPLGEIVGDQIELHVKDREPLVDINGQLLAEWILRDSGSKGDRAFWGLFIYSFFHPIRVSVALKDEAAARELLRNVPALAAAEYSNDFATEVYEEEAGGTRFHVIRLSVENLVHLRVYYAIHDGTLHLTTTRAHLLQILRPDLAESSQPKPRGCLSGLFDWWGDTTEPAARDTRPTRVAPQSANVVAAYRPGVMREERAVYEANFFEASREACVDNFGTLRLFHAIFGQETNARNLAERGHSAFGFRVDCPAGGDYTLDSNGTVSHSVFGSPGEPRIERGKADGVAMRRFFETREARLALEFTPEGIRTHIEMEREAPR